MEGNAAAVECLILFYINTKHILKTKQLDERVFMDQMIRHCKENGFDAYSNEEIRNTWKNITLKYVELKKTGTAEEKETWKYYDILDSCFEQSDFHNGVYPKFSEEMVWFLIECFLKRKHLEKTLKKHNLLTEIHKEFLLSGYLYITKQDIENKWKYLNSKYDRVKDDPESLNKLPYLQALKSFREKDQNCAVNMIFTRLLTEILIERFTEKKITCVIHGYYSEQVLSEIQSEFRELGYEFSQEEIKDRWRKLTNVYSFLKAKGKQDSSWIYYNAMKEHFKDDFLFGVTRLEKDFSPEKHEKESKSRQRSKSVGPDSRNKHRVDVNSELAMTVEQINKEKMSAISPSPSPRTSPSPKQNTEGRKPRVSKRKQSSKKSDEEKLSKKLKERSKSRERKNSDKTRSESETPKNADQPASVVPGKKKERLKSLSIDQNGNQENRGSTELGSPGSKVHIINIDESKIDKKSGNITINLPSITKQFSDNEFLPLKKRLRLAEGKSNKLPEESSNIKDGFLGFPPKDPGEVRKRVKSDNYEDKQLTEEEMQEILRRIQDDEADSTNTNDDNVSGSQVLYKPNEVNYTYQGSYSNNYTPPCLLIPKEEQPDVSLQNYSPNDMTPPPVLLLVIKVDGNNTVKDNEGNIDNKTHIEKKLNESPGKNEALNKQDNLNPVKPISPRIQNCTITKSESAVDIELKDIDTSLNTENKKTDTAENDKKVQSVQMKSCDLNNLQIKNHNSVKLIGPSGKNCLITLNENFTIQSPEKTSLETPVKPTDSDNSLHNSTTQRNEDKPVIADTIPYVAGETIIPATPPETSTKKIRLPVKGNGKVKEIFISPRELKKLTKIKSGDFKPVTSPTKISGDVKPTTSPIKVNDTVKATPEATSVSPPKIKFISQVIKPGRTDSVLEDKPKGTGNSFVEPVEVNCMLPPPAVVPGSSKFLGTNNSSLANKTVKNEEFETESVFSEAVADDECLKDNLLKTVIDFQEQNNQEFVEIKNLMKQNNLLQRETNRLLRLMLEKM